MSLNYVTLEFTEQDAGQDAATGPVTIAPTSAVVAAGVTVVSQAPVVRQLGSGTVSVQLVATDNTGTTPGPGYWAYQITLPGGQPQLYLIPYTGGATQRFDNLTAAVAATVYSPSAAVLSLPLSLANGGTGTDAASNAALLDALGALDASENLADLGNAATARTSLGLGTAATQSTSAFDAAGAAATETARAEAAEAALLPLAGGTMSGAIAMGSHKITGLTNGSGAQDAAAFGQLPSSGTPLALASGGTGLSESTDAALLAALGAAALAGATFTGWLAPAVVTLTDASTVTVNAAAGNDFRLLTTSGVGSTRQLGTPSSPVDGQRITVQVTQDGSGSRLLTYTSAYDFGTTGSPALSTAAAAIDILGFVYNAAKTKWLFLGAALGF